MKNIFVTISAAMPILGVAILLFDPGAVLAEDFDGNSLIKKCKSAIYAFEGGRVNNDAFTCVSYVKGFMDGAMVTTANERYFRHGKRIPQNDSLNHSFYCPPEEFTPTQGVRILSKYLEDNPKELHLPPSVLTMSALREAFPCK